MSVSLFKRFDLIKCQMQEIINQADQVFMDLLENPSQETTLMAKLDSLERQMAECLLFVAKMEIEATKM